MTIKESIGEAALYEQLAEESAELAKAALKKARILRGDNPTPVKGEEADKMVIEEYTDVVQVAKEIGIEWDLGQMYEKNNRWKSRIGWKKGKEAE